MSDTLTQHVPVLLHESVDSLDLRAGKILLDGTFGGGGHSLYALEKFPGLRVIAIDQDPQAITRFQETNPKQFSNPNLEIINGNFKNLDEVLEKTGVEKVDAILLDVGLSSDQLESSGKGFSFQKDEPLDMRMGERGVTAAEVLNDWEEDTLELILRGFGEERYSRKIARAIVERRELKPFRTTFDLVEVVRQAVPAKHSKINPATRTFQAIRIAVNEELTSLEKGLEKGYEALSEGGRMAVISFHSLEDRIVKNFFRDRAKDEEGRLITKKPLTAGEEELERNPRARSAKLRVIEKI